MKRIISLMLGMAMLITLLPSFTVSAVEYVVYNDFEQQEVGDGENDVSSYSCKFGGMSGSRFDICIPPRSFSKGLKMIADSRTSSNCTANMTLIADRAGIVTFAFDIMPFDSGSMSIQVSDRNNGSATIAVLTGGNVTIYNHATGSMTAVSGAGGSYNIEEWNRISITVNTEESVFTFKVNGRTLCEDLTITGNKYYFDRETGLYTVNCQKATYTGGYSEAYLDNVSIAVGEDFDSVEVSNFKEEGNEGLAVRWMPYDKHVTNQNPPSFQWPAIPMAELYELQLSKSPEMTEIAYEYTDIAISAVTPPDILKPGVWYWRIRGKNYNGYTEWTKPKRFRISNQAWECISPGLEEAKKMIPTSHPRLWLSDEGIESFKYAMENNGADFFASVKADVDKKLSLEVPDELPPYVSSSTDWYAVHTKYANYVADFPNLMQKVAFVYKLTGEQKYADKALEILEKMTTWDPNDIITYSNFDQVYRAIAHNSALVFDWLYDLIPADLRVSALEMIREKTQVMFNRLVRMYPLDELPYDSHGRTAANYMYAISIALLHDLPDASEWFDELYPIQMNINAWGGEDGGYSNGTAYGSYGSFSTVAMRNYAYKTAFGFSKKERAAGRNEYKYYLYFSPNGAPHQSFGDETYIPTMRDTTVVNGMMAESLMNGNTAAKWASETRGTEAYRGDYLSMNFLNDTTESVPPLDHLTTWIDRDLGWVAMLSDVIDFRRIGVHFKSSWYGTYNHSHNDQNSFTINAYGEPLATDNGYYDYAGSVHSSKYTNRTHAHNAITYNGGNGQIYGGGLKNINSKGVITAFLHGDDFNLSSGDAVQAYSNAFSKANRYLIYLKPDYVIVVDELASKSGKPMQFEFNLQGYSKYEVDDAKQTAEVTRGRAKLFATMQYPKMASTQQFDKFLTVGGEEVRPTNSSLKKRNHYGVRFNSEKVPETVMVTTFDILKAEDPHKRVEVKKSADCMEISISDTHKVYVRLDMNKEEISYGDVSFKGTAAVFKDDSFMLINGTELKKNGKLLIASDIPNSFSYEKGEFHISANDDGHLKLYAPMKVETIRDEFGYEMVRGDLPGYDYDLMTIKWLQDESNLLDVDYEKGYFNYYINGTPPIEYGDLNVRINGRPAEYENPAFMENGTVYVPLKETVALYDAKVTDMGSKVVVEKHNWGDDGNVKPERVPRTMILKADSAEADFNGEKITLSKPTIVKNGVFYIPLRAYYEVFTERIGWVDYANTAWVYTEPVYHDDVSNTVMPGRTDFYTDAEYEEIVLGKKQ